MQATIIYVPQFLVDFGIIKVFTRGVMIEFFT